MKLIRVFSDVDMRNGHEGLTDIASKEKVKLGSLSNGELVVFVSHDKRRMKVYGSHDLIAYYRAPSGRIEMQMLQYIPEAFSGGKVDFDKSLRKTLTEMLPQRSRE